MRRPSPLVPLGGTVAVVGIHLPIVHVSVHLPGSRLPVVAALNDAIPTESIGASSSQQLGLLGVLALAVAAYLLPRLLPRSVGIGIGLAVVAALIATFGVVRAWTAANEGPAALRSHHSTFLERTSITVLDRLHGYGVLVVHPAAGLWTLTAGAVLLLVGAALTLVPTGHHGSAPRRLFRKMTGDAPMMG